MIYGASRVKMGEPTSLFKRTEQANYCLIQEHTSKAVPMKTCEEWRYGSAILDYGTRWSWVISFTPRPLYPLGKDLPISIGCEVGWATEPAWTLWSRDKSCICQESNLGLPCLRAPLHRLSYPCWWQILSFYPWNISLQPLWIWALCMGNLTAWDRSQIIGRVARVSLMPCPLVIALTRLESDKLGPGPSDWMDHPVSRPHTWVSRATQKHIHATY
jgi:hypothetical protein